MRAPSIPIEVRWLSRSTIGSQERLFSRLPEGAPPSKQAAPGKPARQSADLRRPGVAREVRDWVVSGLDDGIVVGHRALWAGDPIGAEESGALMGGRDV